MKKIYYILVPLIIILVSSAIYFVLSKKENIQNPPLQTTFTEPTGNDEKMTLSTINGDIKVNNLYKNPAATLYHNGVLFQQAPDFEMSFYPDDQGFIISLLNPELQTHRNEAEKVFLETLGINKEQACLFKIALGVDADIA